MAGAPQLIHPRTAAGWTDERLKAEWQRLTAQVRERNLWSYDELPGVLYVNTITLEYEFGRRGEQLGLF